MSTSSGCRRRRPQGLLPISALGTAVSLVLLSCGGEKKTVEASSGPPTFLKTQNYTGGTMVKAGALLFTLDQREYDAQLQQAKAQLEKAHADLARPKIRP